MKTIILTTAIAMVCLAIPAGASAQMAMTVVNANDVLKADPIDDLVFTVQYKTNFMPDTLNPEKITDETMMLKIGKKSSVYYSYAKFLTDSIIEIDKKNGASTDVIMNHLKQYTAKVSYKIYKNHPAGKLTYLDELGMNRYMCEEKQEIPKWTLQEDTMTIQSYPCRKATCHFRGRTYEAWYTPEIPRSEGPWKLQGLPGLIMKAADTQGHYTFDCTGIAQNRNDDEKIMFGADGYEPVSRKNLNKMYERFAADPVGYITMSSPNVKVQMVGKDGSPTKAPRNMPFNPIEKE